jgi:hypothetical protein
MAKKKRPSDSQIRPVSELRPKAKLKRRVATPQNFNHGDLVRPPRHVRENSRLWVGADISLHSMALAGLAWDEVLKKYKGPGFHYVMWNKHDSYFDRLSYLSKASYIYDLCAELNLIIDPQQVYIAAEEPFPFGMAKGKAQSQTLKQQAEMSGAFMAGLLRLGFQNIYQINSAWWRKLVADDLGITTHWSKWGKGIQGKMRPKEWALGIGKVPLADFPNEIPVWPDLIPDSKNGGRKPKPENSKATPIQPDDRYQALPMALWMMREEIYGR